MILNQSNTDMCYDAKYVLVIKLHLLLNKISRILSPYEAISHSSYLKIHYVKETTVLS